MRNNVVLENQLIDSSYTLKLRFINVNKRDAVHSWKRRFPFIRFQRVY